MKWLYHRLNDDGLDLATSASRHRKAPRQEAGWGTGRSDGTRATLFIEAAQCRAILHKERSGPLQKICNNIRGVETRAMTLTLQLVNETTLPDGGPVSFRISGKRGIDIGRAAHLDWTLPDPTRYISSKHCEIRYQDGGYWLHDVSTNGTFLNGADNRMHAPHRLRNGDRFQVGHYIVAVTVDGADEVIDEVVRGTAPPPVHVSNDQELWVNQGDIPPPIDPKQLRPTRHSAPVHPDFLDWSADVPDPFHERGPDFSAPSSKKTTPAPALSDMDWAEGPPSHERAPAAASSSPGSHATPTGVGSQ